MDVTAALLDSWDRQSRIVEAIASQVDESTRHLKPSPDGWPLDQHLAHMHAVRRYFLNNVAPERGEKLGASFVDGWVTPISDLEQIKKLLKASSAEVRSAVDDALTNGVGKFGWYDNAVMFLQHMVWHEGWHVGLIMLGLRLGGHEPSHEWEESTIWDEWRKEEW
jgi:uncharacterized damage-inducible protein DinB